MKLAFMNWNWATIAVLVGLLFVLSMLPRFLGMEGFATLSPSPVLGKATPIGEYDGQDAPSGELTLGNAISGPIHSTMAGGSAFAPAADPQPDPENNQLYHFARNQTSRDAKACLISNYSTSTGCILPTEQDLVDTVTRGGNRSGGSDF